MSTLAFSQLMLRQLKSMFGNMGPLGDTHHFKIDILNMRREPRAGVYEKATDERHGLVSVSQSHLTTTV
jgi:hypothetical protein